MLLRTLYEVDESDIQSVLGPFYESIPPTTVAILPYSKQNMRVC